MILNCGNHPLPDLESSHFFPYSYRAKLISCRLQSCYSMLAGGTCERLLCRPGRRHSVPLTCTRQYYLFLRLFADVPNTQFFFFSFSMLLRCCCLSSKRYTKPSVRHSTTEIFNDWNFSFFTIFYFIFTLYSKLENSGKLHAMWQLLPCSNTR